MACNWLMMTSSGDNNGRVGVWVCSPTKLKKIPKIPKAEQETAQPTAARFKNRALLTLRRSQKHYEIFSNNVLRKKPYPKTVKIGNNRDCVIHGWLSAWVVRDFISHSLHSVVA